MSNLIYVTEMNVEFHNENNRVPRIEKDAPNNIRNKLIK